MSSQEFHAGFIKSTHMDIREYLLARFVSIQGCKDESDMRELFNDTFHNEAFEYNGMVYEIKTSFNKTDDPDHSVIFNVDELGRRAVPFSASFYNGGTCLSEVLQNLLAHHDKKKQDGDNT